MNEWHSVKNDGLPPKDTDCIVTVEFYDGTRNVYDSYKWSGGMWRYWSEQYEEWKDGEEADEHVVAWMPYPEPYEGD